jgi:spermidine/putrescine ABC transporter ATP-binding subunit
VIEVAMEPVQFGERSGSGNEGSVRDVAVSLRNVTKKFGHFAAVDSLSLDIYEGEFLFLLGPSGSGKTTTLRMIAGYEQPTEGAIEIGGKVVNNVPIHERDIGMVFQNYALFPHKTVQDNVGFGLKMRGINKEERQEKVKDALELVRLTGMGARYPRQLSGGQQQRVALARALVFRPSLLILDEPLANLDRKLRDNMRFELKSLQEKVGITTIFVTHDQEEALTMADRTAVMDNGKLIQVGTPGEIYNAPQSKFVATFIGETNSFRGQITGKEGACAAVQVEGGWQVFLCGERHACGEMEKCPSGRRVDFFIRPERILITADKEEAEGNNVYEGKVIFMTYLGAHVMYFVEIKEGVILKVSHPTPTGVADYRVNDRVFLSWKSEQMVCMRCHE